MQVAGKKGDAFTFLEFWMSKAFLRKVIATQLQYILHHSMANQPIPAQNPDTHTQK